MHPTQGQKLGVQLGCPASSQSSKGQDDPELTILVACGSQSAVGEENYRPVREFAGQHNVPIYVGEFGTLRWVPEAVAFLYDQTDLFELYGWSYAVYVWQGDDPYFDGFNLEFGPDPEYHAPVADNPLLGVFLDRWTQNANFP